MEKEAKDRQGLQSAPDSLLLLHSLWVSPG